MSSQFEILQYLKKQEGWVNFNNIRQRTTFSKSSLERQMRKLYKYGFVEKEYRKEFVTKVEAFVPYFRVKK